MAIHITDKATDTAVRRVAAKMGATLTETIRNAVEAMEREVDQERRGDLQVRLAQILAFGRRDGTPLDPRYETLSHKELTDAISGEFDDL